MPVDRRPCWVNARLHPLRANVKVPPSARSPRSSPTPAWESVVRSPPTGSQRGVELRY
jgi:hypothetical protein